jgi:hypothetical protein
MRVVFTSVVELLAIKGLGSGSYVSTNNMLKTPDIKNEIINVF